MVENVNKFIILNIWKLNEQAAQHKWSFKLTMMKAIAHTQTHTHIHEILQMNQTSRGAKRRIFNNNNVEFEWFVEIFKLITIKINSH